VHEWLNQQSPGHWIGSKCSQKWLPRHQTCSSLDFFLWGHMKTLVYLEITHDLDHLQHLITAAFMAIICDMLERGQQKWVTWLQKYQPKWWSCWTNLIQWHTFLTVPSKWDTYSIIWDHNPKHISICPSLN